jgi:tetratricopeptide (TPR) repeat protein
MNIVKSKAPETAALEKKISTPIPQKIETATKSFEPIKIAQKEENILIIEANATDKNITTIPEIKEVKEPQREEENSIQEEKGLRLELIPVLKGSNMFTTTSELKFHNPQVTIKEEKVQETPQPKAIKKEMIKVEKVVDKKEEKKLEISSTEIDTIKYLKNKFFATENIVFAIMLSEEFFNAENYEESIKWALTANEIDSRNDKSWYWFAKNKVKLGQKDDAIKAIESFLGNNTSRRLSDLLKNIKYGDTND